MIAKTLTGISFFDARYGGIYRGRTTLVSGRSGAGKTVMALQFIKRGLEQGERCLMLSARIAADLIIYAEALGFPIGEAINSGNLILLEYQNYVPGRDSEENMTLPPEGFLQFKQIIDTNAVQRVALDTVLPWVAVRSPSNLAEHVFSFVRAFDRLHTTTLLTIPKPVSPMSFRLKNTLEEVIPVAIALSFDPTSGKRFWNVTKYLGENKLSPEVEFTIIPKTGITAVTDEAGDAPQTIRPVSAFAPNRKMPENMTYNGISPKANPPNGKIRFANVIQPPIKAQ